MIVARIAYVCCTGLLFFPIPDRKHFSLQPLQPNYPDNIHLHAGRQQTECPFSPWYPSASLCSVQHKRKSKISLNTEFRRFSTLPTWRQLGAFSPHCWSSWALRDSSLLRHLVGCCYCAFFPAMRLVKIRHLWWRPLSKGPLDRFERTGLHGLSFPSLRHPFLSQLSQLFLSQSFLLLPARVSPSDGLCTSIC